MIAVDTSALMAILQEESKHQLISEMLAEAVRPKMSAATIAEALVVSLGRGIAEEMRRLIARVEPDIITVNDATAKRVAEIYHQWGRGMHPAALNFGDCFSYDVAATHDCPLLYVGNDFAKTDIRSAISGI